MPTDVFNTLNENMQTFQRSQSTRNFTFLLARVSEEGCLGLITKTSNMYNKKARRLLCRSSLVGVSA
ncbi:hypothetical protein Y032_0986g3297 [Ancylostoma ceylanicum]|uniref:Uncharacterized protein n=1 Tax=Ancylostoma ceylanicum TaxID=53326 RepID=A0A016W9S0_9BILA|nr:hypothetical protein Y032_0986g3297 [Ancylostoma ceylanicum]